MVSQLQLRPGSSVLIQGMSDRHDDVFYVRAKTGLERAHLHRTSFTTIIRFPNRSKMLSRFLDNAKQHDLWFQAIRTFGYRGDQEIEVVFEGSFPDDESHFVYRLSIERVLEELLPDPEARTTSTEILQFSRPIMGNVMSTVYHLDIPLIGGRFHKVRMKTTGIGKFFKHDQGKLLLVGLRLDLNSMTLTVDTAFSRKKHFLLVFTGRNLKYAPPVTSTILDSLQGIINVDAISAYEYVKFDPRSYEVGGTIPLSGRIEMLCTADQELDASEEEITLRREIDKIVKSDCELFCFRIQIFNT